ncbi:MAG: hypothetical protein QM765_04850 [Myxococcales bacterium]
MRRVLLGALAALSLANCDALCHKSGSERVCPGDPCQAGASDSFCLECGDMLFCDATGMYDTVSCDTCSPLYDQDHHRWAAVCVR